MRTPTSAGAVLTNIDEDLWLVQTIERELRAVYGRGSSPDRAWVERYIARILQAAPSEAPSLHQDPDTPADGAPWRSPAGDGTRRTRCHKSNHNAGSQGDRG